MLATDRENIVAYQKEITPSDKTIEQTFESEIQKLKERDRNISVKTSKFWGHTLFHLDDITYDAQTMRTADQFKDRNLNARIKALTEAPKMGELYYPKKELSKLHAKHDALPTLDKLGISKVQQSKIQNTTSEFVGGEDQAVQVMRKEVFNIEKPADGGPSTTNKMCALKRFGKFSAWLANGCISVRRVYSLALNYKQKTQDKSIFDLIGELIKRDFLKF